MDTLTWIPGITTTGLLAAALWLSRNIISTRLTRSVEHQFNLRLEEIRADFRTSEERFKAELRSKETEIAALRSGALSALASRQATLDKRRLEAADQIWSAVIALGPARSLTATMAEINFEYAASKAEHDPKMRQLFEALGAGFDQKTMDLSGAAKARPFVSPMVWAIFSAMNSITVHSTMRWQVLKNGLGPKDFTKQEVIAKLIKTALPHYAAYIDIHGAAGYPHLLQALDEKLIDEINKMLNGTESDKASIEQAATIVRISAEIVKGIPQGERKDQSTTQ